MANVIPKEYKYEIVTALKAEEWKVALLKNTFAYVSGTHVVYADVSADQVASTGYTVGGYDIYPADKTITYSGTDAVIDCVDVFWTGVTFTARYACIFETTGGKIRAIYDFGADKTVTGGTFTIQWSTSGLIKIA